jgi:hypothetical protein
VEQSDRVAIFQQFAVWLRAGGIAIFDVREWARTAARYEKSSVHQRTVELPDGTLRFQSETILDWESRQMRIRECFKTSNVSNFVMGCWTPEEVSQRLLTAGFDEKGAYSSYGETDGAWSDQLVLVARKRLA